VSEAVPCALYFRVSRPRSHLDFTCGVSEGGREGGREGGIEGREGGECVGERVVTYTINDVFSGQVTPDLDNSRIPQSRHSAWQSHQSA
jgi:hypothetical protein